MGLANRYDERRYRIATELERAAGNEKEDGIVRTRIAVLAAVLLIVGSIVWYLNRHGSKVEAPLVYAETIEKLDSGSISYEQKNGQILVWIGDPYGDRHVHVLNLGKMSEAEALEMLEAKQKELAGKKVTAEPGAPADG